MKGLACVDWAVTSAGSASLSDWVCQDSNGDPVAPTVIELSAGGVLPSLSVQDGAMIASGILLVWAVAYVARLVIQAVKPRRMQ